MGVTLPGFSFLLNCTPSHKENITPSRKDNSGTPKHFILPHWFINFTHMYMKLFLIEVVIDSKGYLYYEVNLAVFA